MLSKIMLLAVFDRNAIFRAGDLIGFFYGVDALFNAFAGGCDEFALVVINICDAVDLFF